MSCLRTLQEGRCRCRSMLWRLGCLLCLTKLRYLLRIGCISGGSAFGSSHIRLVLYSVAVAAELSSLQRSRPLSCRRNTELIQELEEERRAFLLQRAQLRSLQSLLVKLDRHSQKVRQTCRHSRPDWISTCNYD